MQGNRNYRIAIPTRDSERWIAILTDAYRAIGVEPLYVYDTRSVDRTLFELRRLKAEVVLATPHTNRVEVINITLARAFETNWVVRLDDDEFPSTQQLIQWLDASLEGLNSSSMAICRIDFYFVDGDLRYSRLEDYYFDNRDYGFLDPQWRMAFLNSMSTMRSDARLPAAWYS